MPKISQKLGFTFRIGSSDSYQFGRVDLEISDIDTAIPIESQLEESKEAIKKVWRFLYNAVDSEMESIKNA